MEVNLFKAAYRYKWNLVTIRNVITNLTLHLSFVQNSPIWRNLLLTRQFLKLIQNISPSNNVKNLFKISNKDTRTTSLTSFFCFVVVAVVAKLAQILHIFRVSIAGFKQVNVTWVFAFLLRKINFSFCHCISNGR